MLSVLNTHVHIHSHTQQGHKEMCHLDVVMVSLVYAYVQTQIGYVKYTQVFSYIKN